MDFLGITSSETVRAVLGLEDKELPDSVFSLSQFEDELRTSIEGWLPDTVQEVCAGAAAATTGYAEKLRLLRIHAQYIGAVVISPHLQMGTAAEFSDGQNAFKRKKDAVEEAIRVASDRAATYKDLLETAYEVTAAEAPTLFGSASPTYDPVTGEDT